MDVTEYISHLRETGSQLWTCPDELPVGIPTVVYWMDGPTGGKVASQLTSPTLRGWTNKRMADCLEHNVHCWTHATCRMSGGWPVPPRVRLAVEKAGGVWDRSGEGDPAVWITVYDTPLTAATKVLSYLYETF